MLRNRGFRGIFCASTSFCELTAEDVTDLCVLSCGQYDVKPPFHIIRQNIFESTLELLQRLVQQGCKRILQSLVNHPLPLLDDDSRRAAALLAAEKFKVKIKTAVCQTEAEMLAEFRKFQPDGIAAFHVGQYYALFNAGVNFTNSLKFVLLHKMAEKWGLELGGLVHRNHILGIIASRRMDYMIRHHLTGIQENPELISISPVWYEAQTPLETLKAIV